MATKTNEAFIMKNGERKTHAAVEQKKKLLIPYVYWADCLASAFLSQVSDSIRDDFFLDEIRKEAIHQHEKTPVIDLAVVRKSVCKNWNKQGKQQITN